MPEPRSDKTWATHNGCKGPLVNQTGIAAQYFDPMKGGLVDTTAVYWKYEGWVFRFFDARLFSAASLYSPEYFNRCPAEAPVEWYQVIGAPHGGAATIRGKDAFEIVFPFFKSVEAGLRT